jgi:OHCU decarboxylase
MPDNLHGRPDLAALNRMTPAALAGALDGLFEHSPWVVERAAAARPFADAAALLDACTQVLADATEDERLALIRAHPELAGKAAIARDLTEHSAREQASAGLDRLTAAEFDEFHRLNAAHAARFGFPFIICVRLTDKAGILAAMRRRSTAGRAAEIEEAIGEVGKIARLRLADMVVQPDGLALLEQRVRHDLELLVYPGTPWLQPQVGPAGEAVLDVLIVGGGQSGLGAAFGLRRERIHNVLVLDENPAGLEGPWETYARMVTLRTPKHLTSIEFGLPSLTFRAWWEAQHGADGWAALGKIPRGDWMRYLRWYRRVLDLPVRNDARVVRIEPKSAPGPAPFRVHLAGGEILLARKVILATGIQGGGNWHVPDFIEAALPPSRYAHTAEAIDYAALAGKRIAILGGGASAFDNAQHALGQGAGEVHVFVRRRRLPQVNPIRHMEQSGMIGGFSALDDADKYAVIASFLARNQPPTNDTFARAAAYPGFRLHLGAPWLSVADGPDGVTVTTPDGQHRFDFLVLSTGLKTDTALRPELAELAADVALWRDRFTAPAGLQNSLIDDHPYLGAGFELQPRTPEAAARLHGLFAFNYSALASLGLSASALSGLRPALPKLVAAVSTQLFRDDRSEILARFYDYGEPEFVETWPPGNG